MIPVNQKSASLLQSKIQNLKSKIGLLFVCGIGRLRSGTRNRTPGDAQRFALADVLRDVAQGS
jgi:hypothetical protein